MAKIRCANGIKEIMIILIMMMVIIINQSTLKEAFTNARQSKIG